MSARVDGVADGSTDAEGDAAGVGEDFAGGWAGKSAAASSVAMIRTMRRDIGGTAILSGDRAQGNITPVMATFEMNS